MTLFFNLLIMAELLLLGLLSFDVELVHIFDGIHTFHLK